MSKETYNDRAITQYLLGSLPEAEAERVDELSVTDDAFADALNAAEKDLVDAYVQGELNGAELEQFKFYYLASPLRRERVQFAQALQALAEKNAGTEAAAVREENPAEYAVRRKGSGWFSALSVLMVPRPALRWGFVAAALALFAAGGWLAFENLRMRRQIAQTQAGRDASGRGEQELQKELEGQRSAGARTGQELAREREERERLEQELKQREAQERARTAQQERPPARRSSPSGRVSIASFVLMAQLRAAGQVPTVSIPGEPTLCLSV